MNFNKNFLFFFVKYLNIYFFVLLYRRFDQKNNFLVPGGWDCNNKISQENVRRVVMTVMKSIFIQIQKKIKIPNYIPFEGCACKIFDQYIIFGADILFNRCLFFEDDIFGCRIEKFDHLNSIFKSQNKLFGLKYTEYQI
ncbi:hypothetical protein BpHYR1_048882 [Brachionus plicatilis]|uniref:Uncharacterized protein n=1 Tax=Brachionus plicatilis TaxID=10195 RepID=A0A3M7QK26_BRAPC|nr:hypothetical protein BpHYR1_048882 [Brachionus plicatilis]